jgi:hypothetical protein
MTLVSALLLSLLAAVPQDTGARVESLVITGGTVVDVREYGSSAHDLRDAVVVIERGRITAVGPRASTKTPAGARVIDARGKYIVPGYIDGFASLANQAFANAYLYMGVTSVVSALPLPGQATAGAARNPDPRRAPTFTTANPSPRLFFLGILSGTAREGDSLRSVGDTEVVAQLTGLARAGAKAVLLHYYVTPSAVRAAVARAHELGVATIGELGATTYYEAEDAGVDAFVHTSRYSLELAAPALRAQVALRPFGPPRLEYYRYLLSPPDSIVARHAARLAAGHTLFIPTLSLNYLRLREHENPWREPVAAIIDPALIHLPADRATGAPTAPADTTRDGFPAGTGDAMLALERRYRAAGSRYLTGSGVSAFGTMPGISLHTELELLVRIGLTPRQALAAATWNFSRLTPWSSLGEIAVGRDADVLVLDADPTRDIRNAKRIRAVILGGTLLDRPSLITRAR